MTREVTEGINIYFFYCSYSKVQEIHSLGQGSATFGVGKLQFTKFQSFKEPRFFLLPTINKVF